MDCPGRHSLFSSLDVELNDSATESYASWRVVRHTISQAPIRIAVSGGSLLGSIYAFVRPSPVQQPTMDEIVPTVSDVAFKDQVALIVGGSRGLGELTAKIIAAGGGKVITTHIHGKDDANRVASDIRAHGGICLVLHMDVMKPDIALDKVTQEMESPITHCYYFASSKISTQRNNGFDPFLYDSYCQVYVQAFGYLVNALSNRLPKGFCMFYPSTIFIEEKPRGFGEYIIAKTAGEALCQHFNIHSKRKFILVQRLPRLPTDQTAGLIRQIKADSLSIMIRIVTELNYYFDTTENQT
ncbi:SDR family NAD(P)-dependent oxidoreductase [Candidatus Nomurabacteria bacterium]|nr:SDR family NAD(P)-dependent oxidoreductase [Candidatus Nomurabacteria bacterium]